jgi:hypothetical protein
MDQQTDIKIGEQCAAEHLGCVTQIDPDCQGTHYLQSEISELESRASTSSLWEERYNFAAQANARLEKEKDELLVFFMRAFRFVEHLKHRGECEAGIIPCLNCEADYLAEDWKVYK